MVQRASSCPTQASRTAGAEASDLAGFLESYCLAMLASITSTVFIQLITYSPKLYFFFYQLSYSWASILKHQAPASFSISSVPWHMYKEFPVQSVLFSRSVMSDSLQPHGLKHSRLPCSSPPPRACSNSCPSSQQCHPTISFSVVPFSSHLQSFPASGLFQGVSSSHQVAKVLEFQPQHQNLQWTFRTNFP